MAGNTPPKPIIRIFVSIQKGILMDTMFDTLLQLPLLQGLAPEDFTSILEKVKLHFVKLKPGETIARADSPCNELIFILNGEISATTTSADNLFSMTEHFKAPYLIEPQALFGMYTCYTSKYVATTETNSVYVSKSAVTNHLLKYEIFRLNYLNIASSQAQGLNNKLWGHIPDTLESRICRFILNHLRRPQGPKSLKIKMEDLATIVNDSRNNVSKTLNQMQDKGLLELHRGEIAIPEAERLMV